MNLSRLFAIIVLATVSLQCHSGFADEPPKQSSASLVEILQAADKQPTSVVAGSNGWLYFTPELRSVLSDPFWGDQAAQNSRASNPKFADPFAPIVDFNAQLKEVGIDLWIVPVPAKVCVYPQWIRKDAATAREPRADVSHIKFYRHLTDNGVTVLDLTDEFLKQRDQEMDPLFCQTDSHWSGRGVQVAAEVLAGRVKQAEWYRPLIRREFRTTSYPVEITGDLAQLANESQPVREKLTLIRVLEGEEDSAKPPADDSTSPVLLLGDSHTLVFHDPALHADGCGLADHLAEQLGIGINVIGVRGSGATAARLNWRRRADPLASKKLVIWCFAMRDFTESTDGWRKIPIDKRVR